MEVTNKPLDAIPGWGADLAPENRPGVPMELEPHAMGHAHWDMPEAQGGTPTTPKAVSVERMPPVFGTAEPAKGLSGLMRKAAYNIPEHHVKHWLLLLLSDRVDVAEHNVARVAKWLPVALPVVAAGLWFARSRRR